MHIKDLDCCRQSLSCTQWILSLHGPMMVGTRPLSQGSPVHPCCSSTWGLWWSRITRCYGYRSSCCLPIVFFNNLPRSNPDVACYWLNWTPEDFYNVRKVDTHIHHSAVDWPALQFRFQNLKWSIYWFYWWGILMKATGMNWLGHLLTEAMNAKHLLRFMKKKLKRFSEDIVDVVSAAFGVQIQDKDLYLGFTRKKPISLPVIQNWTWTMCPTCQGLVF